MSRYGSVLAMGAVAALAMAGHGSARAAGEGARRAKERERSRPRPEIADPEPNLPGETNRQYAARMAAQRTPQPDPQP